MADGQIAERLQRPATNAPLITSADQVMELIGSIKAETIEQATISKHNENIQQLDLNVNYERLTPAGNTRAITDHGPSARGLTDFLDSQARINILRGAQGSIRSAASGITTNVAFF